MQYRDIVVMQHKHVTMHGYAKNCVDMTVISQAKSPIALSIYTAKPARPTFLKQEWCVQGKTYSKLS